MVCKFDDHKGIAGECLASSYVHMAHCNRSSLAWIGGKLDGKTFTNALLDIYGVASNAAATIVSVHVQ